MIPIEIHSKAERVDRNIRRFAERRLSFALDRFRNLRRISLSFEDVNGPRGGPDKLCRIVAEFGLVTVVVEEVQNYWQSAVARAIHRVARTAARELGRLNAYQPIGLGGSARCRISQGSMFDISDPCNHEKR